MQIRHLTPRKSDKIVLYWTLWLCKILTVSITTHKLPPNGTHEGAIRVSVLTAYKKNKAVRNSRISSVRMRHILQGSSCSECLKRRGELATADVEIVAVFYSADVLFSVLSLLALILRIDRK